MSPAAFQAPASAFARAPLRPVSPGSAVRMSTRRVLAGAVALLALALMALACWPGAVAAQDTEGQTPDAELPRGVVSGTLVGHQQEGTPVVLLRFQLDGQGQPQGGPIGRTATDAQGGYRFADVPIDDRSVYRIGTRVGGRLVGSDPFTFPRGQQAVTVNLEVPGRSEDASGLRIDELLWVAEPATAGAWVTEVIHLTNPAADVIDTTRAPLELPLPGGTERFEMLRLDAEAAEHERLGPKLLLRGQLPPGTSVVAFRYRLPAPLGRVHWERRYDWPVAALRVLTPEGALQVSGPGLEPGAPETFEETTFSGLERREIAPGEPIALSLRGIPMAQWLFLLPLAGFAVVAGGLVWWFFRARLKPAAD